MAMFVASSRQKFDTAARQDSFADDGGDWSLVASLVFKTMDTLKRRVVGSIPIHLRQTRWHLDRR